MGILNDVKNSITGSDESGGQFDQEKYDNSFASSNSSGNRSNSDLEPDQTMPGMNDQNSPAQGPQGQGAPNHGQEQPPNQIDSMNDFNQQSGPQSTMNNQDPVGNSNDARSMNNNRGERGSPNPQTGRPQPGTSEPQVSGETRDKMQDAGFEFNDQGQNTRDQRSNPAGGSREERTKPISDQQSDIEKVKAQNEQIIELLKRISHAVQDDQNNDSMRSRRHGGRR